MMWALTAAFWATAFGNACGSGASSSASTVTVSVALASAPEQVRSVSVFVTDLDRMRVVASATVAPSVRSIELGVPAERALDFRAVAWTGEKSLDGAPMPAFFGRVLRELPLDSAQQMVRVSLRPAGLLTLAAVFADGLDKDEVRVRAQGRAGGTAVRFQRDRKGRASLAPPLILQEGRYDLLVDQTEDVVIQGGQALYVRRETESLGVLRVEPIVSPRVEETASLTVRLLDEEGQATGDLVLAPPGRTVKRRLAIQPFDLLGRPSSLPVGSWSVAVTHGASVTATVPPPIGALPTMTEPLHLGGTGRLHVVVSARLSAPARTASTDLFLNIVDDTIEPGPPSSISLALRRPEDLALGGSELEVELHDARGLYARPSVGTLDLAESEPWIHFPEGSRIDLERTSRAAWVRRITRPSGPRGRGVRVVATLTSTSGLPLEATLDLPPLERP